jgi:hypothetical protein
MSEKTPGTRKTAYERAVEQVEDDLVCELDESFSDHRILIMAQRIVSHLQDAGLTIVPAEVAASDGVTVSEDEWANEPVTLTAAEHLGATVTIRLEPDDYKAVRQAAKASGMRLTAFVRDAALHASAPASDGVTVSREAVAKAYWNHGDGDLPTWDELDEIAPETKAACYAVADSIIAALHASAPVTTAREGE